VIRDLGLELNIITKGAVMVLPPNINKAAGLQAALAELKLSGHNVVGVGDAENDHAFLQSCGCAAAVSNALPMVKTSADIVLSEKVVPASPAASRLSTASSWLNPATALAASHRRNHCRRQDGAYDRDCLLMPNEYPPVG
jgi:hypothetical protein